MGFLKRILCLILGGSLLFALASCSKNDGKGKKGESADSGRYVETEITPSGDAWLMSFLAEDGSIVCYELGLKTRYESRDGGASWSETPGPGANTDKYLTVSTCTLLPDGRLLGYLMDEGLVLISPDGSSEHYPVPEIDKAVAEGNFVVLSLLQYVGNDRLLLDFSTGGMMVQEGRPIGRAPVGQSTTGPGPGGDAQTPSGQTTVTVGGDADPGEPASDATEFFESKPVEMGVGPGPADNAENSAPQRGNAMSGGTMAFDSMSRQTALYELSTGKLISAQQTDGIVAATADGDNVFLMDNNGNITSFKLSDGTPSGKPAVSLGTAGGSGGVRGSGMMSFRMSVGDVLAMGGNGDLYALYAGNLLLYGAGGEVDTILEGTAYSIGAPNSNATSAFVLDDGSIIVNMLDNMQASRLYRYSFDENASVDPEKSLTVWSLEDNAFVRAAIAELRKKNPDSYIAYEVALNGENAVSPSDAIKTLNTRLLAGTGPDVIILDGCPAESYAGKGMLVDLAGLVDTGDVYGNLLAQYTSDGKMYLLPTQFIMPAMLGSKDALGKVRELDDLVSTIVSGNGTNAMRPAMGAGRPFSAVPEAERAALYFEDVEELCNILWLSCAPDVVGDNKLDSASLKRFLETVKTISDKYELMRNDDDNTMRMGVAFAGAGGGRASILPSSLVHYTSQMTHYGAFLADNLMLMQLFMERDGSQLAAFPGLSDGAWRPSTVVGVSADSAVTDFAVELVKTMLSVGVQRINYGEGLPVTHEGMAAQIRDLNDILAESDRGTFDVDMDALVGRLTSPSVNDTALTDMMRGSIEKLCADKTDVEGAVREIEQSIKNYLAERS